MRLPREVLDHRPKVIKSKGQARSQWEMRSENEMKLRGVRQLELMEELLKDRNRWAFLS